MSEHKDVRYVPGAILISVLRANLSKSSLPKLVGTALYKQMTIRNLNTVRKIYELMTEIHNESE